MATTASRSAAVAGIAILSAKIPVRPGALVKIEGPSWSPRAFGFGLTWRFVSVELDAVSDKEPGDGLFAEQSFYSIAMRAILELAQDPIVELPAFVPPAWPVLVEGMILGGKP